MPLCDCPWYLYGDDRLALVREICTSTLLIVLSYEWHCKVPPHCHRLLCCFRKYGHRTQHFTLPQTYIVVSLQNVLQVHNSTHTHPSWVWALVETHRVWYVLIRTMCSYTVVPQFSKSFWRPSRPDQNRVSCEVLFNDMNLDGDPTHWHGIAEFLHVVSETVCLLS